MWGVGINVNTNNLQAVRSTWGMVGIVNGHQRSTGYNVGVIIGARFNYNVRGGGVAVWNVWNGVMRGVQLNGTTTTVTGRWNRESVTSTSTITTNRLNNLE